MRPAIPTPAARRIGRFAPGLATLLHYDRSDLRHDLLAGVSVAAVALPVGVAYAQLAGFPPVYGLYASILPLVAYAVFGTSRQLVVGPDAATCALVAASVAPLAGGGQDRYLSYSVMLAFLAGALSVVGRFLWLGGLADFLSKPILVGFLNGVSLSILLGQVGKILGFSVDSGGVVRRALEIFRKLPETHGPTLAVGLATFAALAVAPRLLPAFPRNLVAMVAAGGIVAVAGLETKGVAVLGRIPAGLPSLSFPSVPEEHLPPLLSAAAGLAFVSFTSMMLTARSFASSASFPGPRWRSSAGLRGSRGSTPWSATREPPRSRAFSSSGSTAPWCFSTLRTSRGSSSRRSRRRGPSCGRSFSTWSRSRWSTPRGSTCSARSSTGSARGA